MRLAFILSAYRTIFFHAVSQRLEQAGHEIYWLSPNRRWARWLYDHGVAPERVFDLTVHGAEWRKTTAATDADRAELLGLERASGYTAHDIILMDDLLKRRRTSNALRYLAVCARRVRDFLRQRKVEAVSGELTWAFELLTGQVCRQLGLPFWRPMFVRIPEDRFAFFTSRYEKDPVLFRDPSQQDREQARQLLERFRQGPKFAYMGYTSLIILRGKWERLKLIFRHLKDLWGDPLDETSLRPFALVRKHLAMVLRNWRNRCLRCFERVVLPPPRPFVFYPLHLEPEMTIDVMGNPFCNQAELIRAMARTLPASHELWVKEHRIAMSKRPKSFYDEVRAIPGVRLVDPFASALGIMRHADLIVSITGTATYEAALMGRPALTMAPTVFSPVLYTDRFNPFTDSLGRILDEVAGRPVRSDEELIDFLAWLHAQSWPGVVGDALWDPGSMRPENLERVAEAFVAVMAQASKGQQERDGVAARHPPHSRTWTRQPAGG
jgi:hypothetical protein